MERCRQGRPRAWLQSIAYVIHDLTANARRHDLDLAAAGAEAADAPLGRRRSPRHLDLLLDQRFPSAVAASPSSKASASWSGDSFPKLWPTLPVENGHGMLESIGPRGGPRSLSP